MFLETEASGQYIVCGVCVSGMRFGLIQTKVGLISIISNFDVQPSEKTQVPLAYDKNALVLTSAGGMWLKLVNRQDK